MSSKRTILDLWLLGEKQPLIDLIGSEKESRIMNKLREADDIIGFLNRVENFILTLERK